MTFILETLDETGQIDDLLDELAPLDTGGLPTMPHFPAAAAPAPSNMRRWSPGSLPTGVFLRKVNWTNENDYEPPRPAWAIEEEAPLNVGLPLESMPLAPGAVPLRRFLTLVNWENRDDAPTLPTFEAPGSAKSAAGGQIIENFFAGFAFE